MPREFSRAFDTGCGASMGVICGIGCVLLLGPLLLIGGCTILAGSCVLIPAVDKANQAVERTNRKQLAEPKEKVTAPSGSASQETVPKSDVWESLSSTSASGSPKEKTKASKPDAVAKDKPAESKNDRLRQWTDASGSHTIEAEFSGYTAGKVKLRKADGSTIKVPMESLSEADQKWIRNRGR